MQVSLRDTRNGSFSTAEHMEFVKNDVRIDSFRKALLRHCRDKTVLDVGTGSGIWSIIAEKEAGAKKVIAIEKDERIAEIARLNFGRNGLKNTTLIVGNVFNIDKGVFAEVDIVIGELLSTWCIVEPQIPVFRYVMQTIGRTPITIPSKILNYAEGVNATFGDKGGLVIIPTVFFEFSSTIPKSKKLTRSVRASEIDLSGNLPISHEVEIILSAFRSGIVNALRLSSFAETCRGVSFGPMAEVLPRMVVPLPCAIRVLKGDIIRIGIRHPFGSSLSGKGWEDFAITKMEKV